MEKLVVNDDLYLSPPCDTDKDIFVKYLNDEDIYRTTLTVPYPYTRKDAEDFLNLCKDERKKYGRNLYWLVRRNNGEAIGGISFKMSYGIDSHRDELGYWMAKPYWGHGIMTKVLKRFCEYGISYLGLVRIEAVVFENNKASELVLEKNGFKYEGLLKKAYEKRGKYIDGRMYALVK
jgi:ribosomal-protein-alanine N-acetyltransferase